MTKSIFRTCTLLGLSLAAAAVLPAQNNPHSIVGTWDVTVTVTDCQTGALIRTVRSLQMFSRAGAFSETANTALRGSSVGAWAHGEGQTYNANYWFFRYKPDGTFASVAQAVDMVSLGADGNTFTAAGTIQDFDGSNALISTGCFVHSATRLGAGN